MDFPAWDPVLIDIPGLPIDIRWYGLMYVVGFVIAQWILIRLARAGFLPVKPEHAPDLIFYCVFGVMLGGRLGYALFYDPDHQLILPWNFVQVWKGGLAFHGGLAGVVVAAWLFARRHKITWGRVADSLSLAVTPGIFAVRCANFINGELYGRVTTKGVGWAMQFPTDPKAERLLGLSPDWEMRDRELCIQVAFGKRTLAEVQPLLSAKIHDKPVDWPSLVPRHGCWEQIKMKADAAGELLVPYRHPSQLYEGLGEGIVLGLVLLAIYLLTRRRPWRHGRYAATFLLGYAVVRWSLENVRQPDAQFGPTGTVFLGMTMGQTLSLGMVLGALLILFWPQRRE
jgi:phosphatidylglycerol:prolipoprotein diacylglycerol transferase